MMAEPMIVAGIAWVAIFISSACREISEIEKEIHRIEEKTERMQADPRPKYVNPQY